MTVFFVCLFFEGFGKGLFIALMSYAKLFDILKIFFYKIINTVVTKAGQNH